MLEIFKLLKIERRYLISNRTFCCGAQLDVTCGGELEYSKCPVFKTKDTTDLKTCQEINFWEFLHKVARLQILVLEFYDVT